MEEPQRSVRKFIMDFFVEHAFAPSVAEIGPALKLSGSETGEALLKLDRAHHLKLLEGTFRILMAFPFSAISTPYRVERSNGQRYFANCAWDAIAFHPMLNEPIRVDSFCDACSKRLAFRVEEGRGGPTRSELPRVRLGLPAADWWKNITLTCANTMVFLGAEEFAVSRDREGPTSDPGVLTIDQMVQLSIPIYGKKLNAEYERPAVDEIRANFERLGLSSSYWRI